MELSVRETLSEYLKGCRLLPNDIALSLAKDVETVALPMIRFSEALNDADLIRIVRARGEAHQTAVASRKTVSAVVSDAIIATGNEAPLTALVANDGASISEAGYDKILVSFPDSEAINGAMVVRPDLPVAIAEKLAESVSEQLCFALISRHVTTSNLIERLTKQGSEYATIVRISHYDDVEEVSTVAQQLHHLNRLTPTLLLRAIYCGQLDFFEFAIAHLSQTKLKKVRAKIRSTKPDALHSLYQLSHLPAQLYLVFKDALQRLAEEIARLDSGEDGNSKRRLVSSLINGEDFDTQQFESALLIADQR